MGSHSATQQKRTLITANARHEIQHIQHEVGSTVLSTTELGHWLIGVSLTCIREYAIAYFRTAITNFPSEKKSELGKCAATRLFNLIL